MDYYIGLDIGGTKCAATLGTLDGVPVIIDKDYFLTADNVPEVILERFSSFIEKHLQSKQIMGIGISCGGPLDSKRGVIMKPPSLQLWDDVHIVEYFEGKFKIKTYLQNDANACAVAEWKYGAGKCCRNMVFLTFGTGFGAGLIIDGHLYSGANDNAGEIGHIRLTDNGPEGYYKKGSCEGYCSGSGIARLADIMAKKKQYAEPFAELLGKVGKENINAKTIAEQARLGNAFCKAVYRKSGAMLGRALSIIIDLINPERIVIGGVFMRSGDLLYPYAEKVMKKECLSYSYSAVEVVPAQIGENIGDFAALSIAKGDF